MVLVVLFFVFSFLAVGGTYLNINPYDNLNWIKAIVHFMFLIFTMMIIPFCYKKFSGKATVKNGRRVCKWNCLIVLSLYFVIDIFLMGGIYDETFQNLGANLIYTLMFYYINLKVFFNKNKLTEEAIPCESEKEHIENTQKTLELDIDKMSPQEAAEYLVAEQLGEKYTPQEKQKNSKGAKTKYCTQCGSLIDNETKKCIGCGKQYLKISTMTILIFTISIAVLVLIIVLLLGRPLSDNNSSEIVESNNQTSTIPYYSELGLTYSQYQLAEKVSDNTSKYCEYMAEIKSMVKKATYNDDLKKEKVIEYINSLSLDYGQKIILYRIQFPNDATYNSDIVDYLNERDNIYYNDMVFILEELGFAVFEDGTVKW